LQNLTLLVGPNGAGKSNFFDSLRFLAHSMHVPLEEALAARSGILGVLRKLPGGRIASSFSIAVDLVAEDGSTGTYSLTVGAGPDGSATIDREECRIGDDYFTGWGSHSTTAYRAHPLSHVIAQPSWHLAETQYFPMCLRSSPG
jgi:hypothetical protein